MNFSGAPPTRFSWNIWNNFRRQDKTVAHSLGFGEPGWDVFLQRGRCSVETGAGLTAPTERRKKAILQNEATECAEY